MWVIGRIVYFLGYREAVPKRTPGFAIQAPALHRVVDRRAWLCAGQAALGGVRA